MRKMYHTEYRVNGTPFGSYVLAESEESAQEYIEVRNLGEVRCDSMPTQNLKLAYTSPEFIFDRIMELGKHTRFKPTYRLLHLACFLLNLGEQSKRIVIPKLFSDIGMVHQLVHMLTMEPFELSQHLPSVRNELVLLAAAAPEMFLTPEERAVFKLSDKTPNYPCHDMPRMTHGITSSKASAWDEQHTFIKEAETQ